MEKWGFEYNFNERELTKLAYRYLGYKKYPEAVAVLKLNVEAYPESWSVYDTYAEALLKNGNKEMAIVNYRKSIELNPENNDGIKKLKELGLEVESQK